MNWGRKCVTQERWSVAEKMQHMLLRWKQEEKKASLTLLSLGVWATGQFTDECIKTPHKTPSD